MSTSNTPDFEFEGYIAAYTNGEVRAYKAERHAKGAAKNKAGTSGDGSIIYRVTPDGMEEVHRIPKHNLIVVYQIRAHDGLRWTSDHRYYASVDDALYNCWACQYGHGAFRIEDTDQPLGLGKYQVVHERGAITDAYRQQAELDLEV